MLHRFLLLFFLAFLVLSCKNEKALPIGYNQKSHLAQDFLQAIEKNDLELFRSCVITESADQRILDDLLLCLHKSYKLQKFLEGRLGKNAFSEISSIKTNGTNVYLNRINFEDVLDLANFLYLEEYTIRLKVSFLFSEKFRFFQLDCSGNWIATYQVPDNERHLKRIQNFAKQDTFTEDTIIEKLEALPSFCAIDAAKVISEVK